MVQLIFTIFVPIMGRRGMTGNPDVILGVATAFFTVLLLIFVFPVLVSIRRPKWLQYLLTLLFTVTVSLISLSNYGFPYTGDMAWPAPKRISVNHVSRTMEDGVTDGGLLVCRQDHYSLSHLEDNVPDYSNAHEVTQEWCDERMACGLPSYSMKKDARGCLWIPVSPPTFHQPTGVTVTKTEKMEDNLTNITMAVAGPNRVLLLMSALGSANIVQWSLGNVSSNDKLPYYTAQLIRGYGNEETPHTIWVVVKGWSSHGDDRVVVSVSGHYTSGLEMTSSILRRFRDSHPSWTSLQGWTVDYKYLVI